MKKWNYFDHGRVYPYLETIANKVQSMGAQVSSCGEGKISIHWPERETIYVRRYHQGPYRWQIFTASKYRSLILAQRDPSIRELQTASLD